jgi:hypothetical protein
MRKIEPAASVSSIFLMSSYSYERWYSWIFSNGKRKMKAEQKAGFFLLLALSGRR